MELKVIKPFHGKVEGKVMNKGVLIHSADVERINALVSGGYCVIVSLADTEGDASGKNGGETEKPTKKSSK